MKIDNWTIDEDNKVLTLNDLKTSSKPCAWFMNPDWGSMKKYHYARQFLCYSDILKKYCEKEFGYGEDWTFKANVCVVETFGEHNSKCFKVPEKRMEAARPEFEKLMKMIGYYTIYGYDEEVEFI